MGSPAGVSHYAQLYLQEVWGVENLAYLGLDLTNPDDHYRYLPCESYKDCLIPMLPDYYATAE